MSLRLIMGRAGSGKSWFVLEDIKKSLHSGIKRPRILLVPEQFSFQAEKELAEVMEGEGVLEVQVLSFRRLAFRVFNEAGGLTRPHVHPAGKAMLLYRIMDTMKGKLRYFSRAARRRGFAGTMGGLITEFKRYNVKPETLLEAAEKMGGENSLTLKMNELAAIYAAFEEQLKSRYRDSDDDLTLACDKLLEEPLYKGAEIWIDGFSSFTPQEYRLMECLMKTAFRVSISLCAEPEEEGSAGEGIDVFHTVFNAARKLKRLALEAGTAEEPPVRIAPSVLPRFSGSRELAHLEKNYGAYPPKEYKEVTRSILLYPATNTYSEVEAAACEILRLCRDRGCRFRDIAVVTRDLKGYRCLVEAVFSEYAIPFFLDGKLAVVQHPLARLVLSAMAVITENWSYDSVFRYLKTGLTGIEPEAINRLENYVLACGIRGSRWSAGKDWDMSPDLLAADKPSDSGENPLDAINAVRKRVYEPLRTFRDRVKGGKTAAVIAGALFELLCELGVPDRLSAMVGAFRKEGDPASAAEYTQVWNNVMAVFDQAVEVMGDDSLTLERFSEALEIGLGEYELGLIPAALDQVLVGSVERSKSQSVKFLFVLGVNDGIFPSSSAEEGVLTDRERASLDRVGLELAGDSRSRALDEQFLIYKTLSTATRYLRISWPVSDREGRSLRPSMIVARLRKVFPHISETGNLIPSGAREEALFYIQRPAPAYRRMISSLREKADGGAFSPVWLAAGRWFQVRASEGMGMAAVMEAFLRRNEAEVMEEATVAALYGDPSRTSVSRLESFATCPFSYFVKYGLNAQERKMFRLSAPDVGTFMHEVIRLFSEAIEKGEASWRDFSRAWCEEKVSAIVDEMLQKMGGSGISGSRRYTALTLRLKRVITRAVWLVAGHIRRSSFEPLGYEMGFGTSEKFPPIVIELDSGKRIYLTGRIDRVDALRTEEGTYLRIVDYKSGAKDFKLSDLYYGLQIQLVTYMDALWGVGDYLPGGMLYFRVDDPIIKKNGPVTEEEIEDAIQKQLKMRGLLLADVRLIRQMDREFTGTSPILPVSLTKAEALGKNSSVASLDQFKVLRRYTRRLLKSLCGEILTGSAAIRPYKKKSGTSCQFCAYSAVCQFDPSRKDNGFRQLYDRPSDKVWDMIDQEEGTK